MDNLISGLLGALIATVLAILYQHVRVICDRKYETAASVVEFFDEIYFHLRQVNIYYKLKYAGKEANYPRENITVHKNKIDDLVNSSKVQALVALNYGLESEELDMANALRNKLFDASLLLFSANKDAWKENDKKFNEAFSSEIDPMRNALEVRLMKGITFYKTLKSELYKIVLKVKNIFAALNRGSLGE